MGGPPTTLEGQTYCLRWNNHKSNLVEILDALIKMESYVDCTIVVDDQVQFKAHRVILAASSPYFQSILQDVPMDHCSILFPGVQAFEMRALLEYMYTGEVNVTQSQIPKIMRIAEQLEVKGLFDITDLKERFTKFDESNGVGGSSSHNPYAPPSGPAPPPALSAAYSSAATTSSAYLANSKDSSEAMQSSPVISTSTNISPSAAPTSSSSPPHTTYKSPYANIYSKSPGPSSSSSSAQQQQPQPSQQLQSHDRQWPISPIAAAMLSSVYESAPDMNPLKRKKLSSISSMLMNRDTPILRNVLAQTTTADSSQQPIPLVPSKTEKSDAPINERSSSPSRGASSGFVASHTTFNGSDYANDKKSKYHEEPHSPYTDRSFEDDGLECPPNYPGDARSFGSSQSQQKPEWKRYKQYTRNDIMSAIQCVRDGMSALQASRKFGVPSRTLYDKVKKMGITTGRPMNRTLKRSPSVGGNSAAFSYSHGYGQSDPAMSSLNDGSERETNEKRPEHHIPPTIPHPAAALLDHAFLQQALENRGGNIDGREALHAMALAAAAHAAVNHVSTSPGPNGTARSPSPSFAIKYARSQSPNGHMSREREIIMEREKERRMIDHEIELEREREHEKERMIEREQRDRRNHRHHEHYDRDEEDDHVEDLSIARKNSVCSDSPPPAYSPPSPPPTVGSVIVPPMTTKLPAHSSDDYTVNEERAISMKREIIAEDHRD